MPRTFELPIIYRNEGVAPRHRNPGSYTVRDTALFSFPEADRSELLPALTMRHRYRLDGDEIDRVNDNVLKQYNGHLVKAAGGSARSWSDMSATTETLARIGSDIFSELPVCLRVPSMSRTYEYRSELYEARKLNSKHIRHSGRQDAVAELQAHIDRTMVIVDGQLFVHAPDPRINVRLGDGGVTVERLLVASGHFSFPPDRSDLADEFVDWLGSDYGLPLKTPYDPHSRGTEFIIESEDIPFSGNPIIEAALDFASRAELNIVNRADYGEETKRLGLAFQADQTLENAMEFMDALEEAALGGQYPDGRYSGEERAFAVFRKFMELMPSEYKEGYSPEIMVPMTWCPTS